MDSINRVLNSIFNKLGKNGRVAVISAFLVGLFAHFPILVSDIPNHDGLQSMYFNQNMITSGRWFLGVACGLSSFYSIPWLIGILGLVYLSITAVLLVKMLDIDSPISVVIISALLVTYPSLASNFAYVFTLDGYMLGVLFAVLSVYFTKKFKAGFLLGGVSLALSMGIYQAYLPIAILLCLYEAIVIMIDNGIIREKLKAILAFIYMGAIGVTLYFVMLRILLLIQNKSLDTYQGINEMASGTETGIISMIRHIYRDFASFVVSGKILYSNVFSLVACLLILSVFSATFLYEIVVKKLYKKWVFYLLFVLVIALIPVFANAILLISPNVTYHLLMRYQYCFLLILMIAYVDRVLAMCGSFSIIAWITVLSSIVIVFCYLLSDNIAYSNLQKKYEKTYAYCVRLADRIEQTEGYYQGIPIYMIGVVGDNNFPKTDITEDVTGHMIGMYGDYLLYTPENYELFFKHFLGISFNFLRPSEANFYDTKEYIALSSFPGNDSTKVVNGILYVKTENMH